MSEFGVVPNLARIVTKIGICQHKCLIYIIIHKYYYMAVIRSITGDNGVVETRGTAHAVAISNQL